MATPGNSAMETREQQMPSGAASASGDIPHTTPIGNSVGLGTSGDNFYYDSGNNITHYVINNYYYNCPVHFGRSEGNTYNFDVRLKLYGPPDLLTRLERIVGEREPQTQTTLMDVVRECDARAIRVGRGCVEVTLRVSSRQGLEKLWAMFSSGELEGRLKSDLPINRVRIPEDDYREGCIFFESIKKRAEDAKRLLKIEVDKFERAATAYLRCRRDTVDLLRGLAKDVTQQHRNQVATMTGMVAAAVGVGLAFFTGGLSLPLGLAAAAGAGLASWAVVAQVSKGTISTVRVKRVVEADRQACYQVEDALERVEQRLIDWKRMDEMVSIETIYNLVGVDIINLREGEARIRRINKEGTENTFAFVVLPMTLESRIVHVLKMFKNKVPETAQWFNELAGKLECPREGPMTEIINSIRETIQLTGKFRGGEEGAVAPQFGKSLDEEF